MAEAILKNLHEKVFNEVMARANIPTEFGNREDLTKASEELQRIFKDRLMRARMKGNNIRFAKQYLLKHDITIKER